MYTFFAKLSRMKYINRWSLMRNTVTENIAEHSLEVGMIAHALAVIGNTRFGKNLDCNRLAVLAMYHDTTEIITGDMPTPVKYYAPEIRDAYKNVERVAAEQLLSKLPPEMKQQYESIMIPAEADAVLWRYVKAADKLSAYIKCIEEISMGNSDFAKAHDTIAEAVRDMQMEEVDYFVEQFLPAYYLTVDEQA